MAYKRISPTPIEEGGTNATTMATTDGILYYDGTRFVTTTAGTSGQLMTSNGAGIAPTYQTGSGIMVATRQLLSSEVKALHAVPITLIATPGSGNVIWILNGIGKMNYGGSNVFVAAAAQTIGVFYGTSTGNKAFTSVLNGQIVAAASSYTIDVDTAITGVATTWENTAVILANPIATEISGNAANDNTITVQVVYRIITL